MTETSGQQPMCQGLHSSQRSNICYTSPSFSLLTHRESGRGGRREEGGREGGRESGGRGKEVGREGDEKRAGERGARRGNRISPGQEGPAMRQGEA